MGINTAQFAGQGVPKPFTSRLARRVCPANPVVSTVILGVPWPLIIRPPEMVQLKLGAIPAVPPVTFAVKVTGAFSPAASGQEIETVGQTGCGGGGGGH